MNGTPTKLVALDGTGTNPDLADWLTLRLRLIEAKVSPILLAIKVGRWLEWSEARLRAVTATAPEGGWARTSWSDAVIRVVRLATTGVLALGALEADAQLAEVVGESQALINRIGELWPGTDTSPVAVEELIAELAR